MNIGKNLRTKISTIVAIGAFLNMALAEFNPYLITSDERIITAYRVLSMLFAACAWINSHYYNQDFTDTASKHTGAMRQEKKEQDPDYIGERFYTDDEGNPLVDDSEEVSEDE